MNIPKHFPCPACGVTVHPISLESGEVDWDCHCGAAGTFRPSGDPVEDHIQRHKEHRYDFGMHDLPPIGNERVI